MIQMINKIGFNATLNIHESVPAKSEARKGAEAAAETLKNRENDQSTYNFSCLAGGYFFAIEKDKFNNDPSGACWIDKPAKSTSFATADSTQAWIEKKHPILYKKYYGEELQLD